MKSNSLLVLACLFSVPTFAQTLPDEINYWPYLSRFRELEQNASAAQTRLNQSRVSLSETRKFISEMSSHIATLESNISSAVSQINRLRMEIDQLERHVGNLRSEDFQVMNELRMRQSEEQSLVALFQQEERQLRPLEAHLARKEQKLRELMIELAEAQKIAQTVESQHNKEVAEAQSLERKIDENKVQQRQLENELIHVEARVATLEGEISRLEGQAGTLTTSLSSQRSELANLQAQVEELKNEVAQLRAANAPQPQIAQAVRQLEAAKNARDKVAQEIKQTENQIERNNDQVKNARAKVAEVRRDQQTLPGKIAQAEARERELKAKLVQTHVDINRLEGELREARRNVEVRKGPVEAQRQEVRSEEVAVNRQRQVVENISRRIESTRSVINNLVQRSRDLNNELARSIDILRGHQVAIPGIEQDIRHTQSEISTGERDLAAARNDERTMVNEVAQDEIALQDAVRERNQTENEMNVRYSLYQRYLGEAKKLGSNQAANGTALGNIEGQRLSSHLSKQNGIAVGQELGKVEAKYWGSVRGEIQGYDLGHSEGLNSEADRSRAQAEASAKAAVDSELFAQTNLRPVFFEEFVQEEFKKPFTQNLVTKSLKTLAINFQMEEALDTISPLTPEELAYSRQVVTPLDALIVQRAKEVKVVEDKAHQLGKSEVAFEVPTRIPHGTASCTQVYKSLPVFKTACEGSYKESFTENYIGGARATFSELYSGQFISEFNVANVSQREGSYPDELAQAHKVGHAEGLKVGKIEIFQTTYERTYKTTYASELEKARVKAKSEASKELANFLKVKPLLTVASSRLTAENFRGGEEVLVLGRVKNVSVAALNGPVLVRLTEVVNAEKIESEAVLNQASGLAITDLPNLKVKVAATAKAGDKLIVRGVVDLPGDLYKTARQEKFELIQVLSANPAHDLKLNYNAKPDIKGVFRRNIHFLTASIAPKVEEIREGYKVAITPVGSQSTSMIQIQVGSLDSGALGAGNSKDLRFSYLFNDSSKNKKVTLELTVSFLGKTIKKELITLFPN